VATSRTQHHPSNTVIGFSSSSSSLWSGTHDDESATDNVEQRNGYRRFSPHAPVIQPRHKREREDKNAKQSNEPRSLHSSTQKEADNASISISSASFSSSTRSSITGESDSESVSVSDSGSRSYEGHKNKEREQKQQERHKNDNKKKDVKPENNVTMLSVPQSQQQTAWHPSVANPMNVPASFSSSTFTSSEFPEGEWETQKSYTWTPRESSQNIGSFSPAPSSLPPIGVMSKTPTSTSPVVSGPGNNQPYHIGYPPSFGPYTLEGTTMWTPSQGELIEIQTDHYSNKDSSFVSFPTTSSTTCSKSLTQTDLQKNLVPIDTNTRCANTMSTAPPQHSTYGTPSRQGQEDEYSDREAVSVQPPPGFAGQQHSPTTHKGGPREYVGGDGHPGMPGSAEGGGAFGVREQIPYGYGPTYEGRPSNSKKKGGGPSLLKVGLLLILAVVILYIIHKKFFKPTKARGPSEGSQMSARGGPQGPDGGINGGPSNDGNDDYDEDNPYESDNGIATDSPDWGVASPQSGWKENKNEEMSSVPPASSWWEQGQRKQHNLPHTTENPDFQDNPLSSTQQRRSPSEEEGSSPAGSSSSLEEEADAPVTRREFAQGLHNVLAYFENQFGESSPSTNNYDASDQTQNDSEHPHVQQSFQETEEDNQSQENDDEKEEEYQEVNGEENEEANQAETKQMPDNTLFTGSFASNLRARKPFGFPSSENTLSQVEDEEEYNYGNYQSGEEGQPEQQIEDNEGDRIDYSYEYYPSFPLKEPEGDIQEISDKDEENHQTTNLETEQQKQQQQQQQQQQQEQQQEQEALTGLYREHEPSKPSLPPSPPSSFLPSQQKTEQQSSLEQNNDNEEEI
jgi:hypothetical protein